MQNNETNSTHPLVLWLKKYILNNWQWKLLSFLIAVLLWGGLITQDDSLTREKTFNDVTLNITNSDTLRRNGYIIVDGLDDLPTLKMRVEVPQRMYATVAASNYNPRIDLSKINGIGQQTLKISTTNTTTYGIVSDISETHVTLTVEEYITRSRIPVRLSVIGEFAEGLYGATPSTDPLYVTVSGPKSLVNNIVRCVVEYNVSELKDTGNERTAIPFTLVDSKGKAIDSTLIEVTSESVLLDSIMVEQNIYASKTLPINTIGLTSGSPSGGYAIKSVTAEPATITVAGVPEWINSVSSFNLADFVSEKIDVSGATGNIHRSVRIVKNANIAHFSQETLLITIEIAAK